MTRPPRLIVIGGGNMAAAILTGAAAAGVLSREDVWVAEPGESRRRKIAGLCARAFPSGSEAIRAELEAGAAASPAPGAQVLLAVKPQSLDAVAADLASLGPSALRGRVVISILAGVTREGVARALAGAGGGGEGGRCVRVMPNTPARIRMGITAIARADDLSEEDVTLARAVFSAVGEVVEIDESLMNAFTAVAGSGPAYVFRMVEALAAAAEAVGFDAATAGGISRATVTGSAALLAPSDDNAAELRAAVTSKGGTTEAGLQALEAAGFESAIAAAVRAARDRGDALSAGPGG